MLGLSGNIATTVTQNVVMATKEVMLDLDNNRSVLQLHTCISNPTSYTQDDKDEGGLTQDISMVSRNLKSLNLNKESPASPPKKKFKRRISQRVKKDQQTNNKSKVMDNTARGTQKRPRKSTRHLKQLTRKLFESGMDSPSSDLETLSKSSDTPKSSDNDSCASPLSESHRGSGKARARRRSLRLQKKHQLCEQLFQTGIATPVSMLKGKPCNILVYDTPEEEYGLTTRQRRLKYLRRRQRVS